MMRLLTAFILLQVITGPHEWVNPNKGRWYCDYWGLPDIDQDGDVDDRDWYYWWNHADYWPRECNKTDGETCCRADLNRDGWIDYDDVAIMIIWMEDGTYHPIDYLDWCCLDPEWKG